MELCLTYIDEIIILYKKEKNYKHETQKLL